MTTRRLLPFLAALLLAACGLPGRADEIDWRKDYASALQEARAKGLPLVLDFGTDACLWCDKLDVTTFRDPEVVRLVNGRFIPLKVHAARYPDLIAHLKIQSYPTFVVADPSGRILNAHAGFLEAPAFLEFLRRVTPPSVAAPVSAAGPAAPAAAVPAWMSDDLQNATEAVARSEYARAVGLLKNILKEDGKNDAQAKAARLLEEIEKKASTQLERVKELRTTGPVQDALQAARELAHLYEGTAGATEAAALLPSLTARLDNKSRDRGQQAHEMMQQAQEDFRTQQYLVCLVRCDTISTRFADLPEGVEATELVEKITNNPEWMQQVCDTVPDLGGMSFLKMAEAKLKQGQPQQAVFFLERLLQTFPNTRHAEMAHLRLSQIQGPPPLPVSEEKKQ
ncbi:MAG: DUF255 domain-containing protein [Planctomycetes bacterium]|nr:DUF255 domain-containing protein [Planctomycetota bacterium]